MFKWLYEKATGTTWTTSRSCTTEFGRTPGAKYRHIVAGIPDEVLLAFDPAELNDLLSDLDEGWRTPHQARYVLHRLSRQRHAAVS